MSKRISLKEFQESLVQRLTSAKTGETQRAMLGVQVGREFWLTDLADAGEIVPLPAITPVPLAKPWFQGLANIRGTLYSVVDFSAFQGSEPTPLIAEARLLLPNVRFNSSCALLVNRAMGLKSAESFEPGQMVQDSPPWTAGELLDSHGYAWKKLSFGDLLNHPRFLDAGI